MPEPLTTDEQESLRLLARAGKRMQRLMLAAIFGPLLLGYPLLAAGVQPSIVLLLALAGIAPLLIRHLRALRCPKCRHGLFWFVWRSEYGAFRRKPAPCPGCGVDLKDLVPDA